MIAWTIAYFVRRWQVTFVLLLLFGLLGLNAFFAIPRAEDPSFPIPVTQIVAAAPGASPLEIEQLVAKPLEDAIMTLDNVKTLESFTSDGYSVVAVQFEWGGDGDRDHDQVVREVNALRSALPQNLSRLEVRRVRTGEVAVMQLALVSETLPDRRLEKLAEQLRDRLNLVPGVRKALYWGAAPSEVRVGLDMGRLAQLRIPPDAVVSALRASGAESPIGAVHTGARRLGVKPASVFRNLDVVAETPIAAPDGQLVRVRDVADVGWDAGEATYVTRFNGQRALFLTISKRDAADVRRVTAQAKRVVNDFRSGLPPGVRLETAFVQADNVERRLSALGRDFQLALVLVLLTLAPLGFRAGLIVAITIPLSLLSGLAALWALGETLNQLSIAGFVLSLGLLVDDAIVVTENMTRRLREGTDRLNAAIAGAGQIAPAVLGCTAALVFAFLPLMALPDAAGAFIRALPLTVVVTITASLVISLGIVPLLASRFLPRTMPSEGNILLRAVNRDIHRLYAPVLHRALGRPRLTLALVFGLCTLSVPLLAAAGSNLFPPAEIPQFMVRITTPDGTSTTRTGEVLAQVERRLRREPEVAWVAGSLGRGNPQVYYNVLQFEGATNFAEALVSLRAWRGAESERLLNKLRADFSQVPGAQVTIVEFRNGSGIEAPVAVRIIGRDLTILRTLAGRTEAILKATPGVRAVNNPLRLERLDLSLGVDRDKAAILGVSAGAAEQIARLALSGEPVARYRDEDGDDYPVVVRLPMVGRHALDDLDHIYVPAVGGAAVRLSEIAEPRAVLSPARIDHRDRERMVTVSAQAEPGHSAFDVLREARGRLAAQVTLPAGYRFAFGGEAEASNEAFGGVVAAMIFALLGVLAVLVLEFGSFRTTLVVAGVIPLGLFGAALGLAVGQQPLSFTAAVGIVALVGIETKNSILLVDFTQQLLREGVEFREAVERAGEVRFLPVLLTSATAILALTPLAAAGSKLYAPLAAAVIGGLVVSTMLARISTPTMYLLLSGPHAQGARRWGLSRWSGRRA